MGRAKETHTCPNGRGKFHLALLLVAPLFVACDEEGSNDGDCSARIGWEGTVYRPHNELNPKAARGEPLGTGEVLDCDGSAVASVKVFAVEGVDTSIAIKVVGEWRGVYVDEDASKPTWPEEPRTR